VAVEIERKYLLAEAPPAEVLTEAAAYDIEQTYLTADSGSSRRVRRRTGRDGVRHWLTEKGPRSGISREEDEREIDEGEYRELLEEADRQSGTIVKTRYVFSHGDQTLELDVFRAPEGLVLLEVELVSEDEAVELPAWAAGARDVSDDESYSNAALARQLGGSA
jgi:CYTH domain-containing protein